MKKTNRILLIIAIIALIGVAFYQSYKEVVTDELFNSKESVEFMTSNLPTQINTKPIIKFGSTSEALRLADKFAYDEIWFDTVTERKHFISGISYYTRQAINTDPFLTLGYPVQYNGIVNDIGYYDGEDAITISVIKIFDEEIYPIIPIITGDDNYKIGDEVSIYGYVYDVIEMEEKDSRGFVYFEEVPVIDAIDIYKETDRVENYKLSDYEVNFMYGEYLLFFEGKGDYDYETMRISFTPSTLMGNEYEIYTTTLHRDYISMNIRMEGKLYDDGEYDNVSIFPMGAINITFNKSNEVLEGYQAGIWYE